jgi:hypothetical protein
VRLKPSRKSAKKSSTRYSKKVARQTKKSQKKQSKTRPKVNNESIQAFIDTIDQAQKGNYEFIEGHHDKGSYFLVNEANRGGSSFVHIVPKELYEDFLRMQKSGDIFIGFSMLCGKNGNRDLRVSCFGISTNDLTRAMIKR